MNKRELAALTQKWNDRLKEEGFHDIEQGFTANKSSSKQADEKIKNGDSQTIEAIYTQFLDFYRNNDFVVMRKRDTFPAALRKTFTASDLEKIFLMWVEGETIRFIAGFFLPHLSYYRTRDYIYMVLKAIFKYALSPSINSKSLKFEARTFIKNFSDGFSKRGGVGRGGKSSEKRSTCKECQNKYYPQEKKAVFDYCPECVQIVEYARAGGRKEVKYILKSTGKTLN